MTIHVVRITALTALVVLCTVLPFLPGRYDSLAVSLSKLSLLFGKVGLVLVPLGALWLGSEYRSRNRGRRRVFFTWTAFIAASLVWLILSVGALDESFTLGLTALALWVWVLVKHRPGLRPLSGALPETVSPGPFYLLVIPVAVALMQFVLAEPVTDFSRARAIRNSAPLIADIERSRAANGRYPLSTLSVWPDYKPAVIGIRAYQYESTGNAYNVVFEQSSFRLGTTEIVMYNPRGEQAMASHAMDVLQLTPEQLALDRTRGHYAVHDTADPGWKYFWFD